MAHLSFAPKVATVTVPTLARVTNGDFLGGELIGADGTTFKNATAANRPVLSGGEVVFDYDDVLSFDWAGNLEGKTLFVVAEVLNCGAATDSLFTLAGTESDYRIAARQTNGDFKNRVYSTGMGLPTTYDVRGTYNSLGSTRNEVTIYTVAFGASDVVITCGNKLVSRAPYSGGSRAVNKISLGNAQFRTAPMNFKELRLIDSATDADVNAVSAELATTYDIGYTPRTIITAQPVVAFGDSIGVGFLSDGPDADALDREGINDLFEEHYLPAFTNSSDSGSFLSPTGDAAADNIAGSWPFITASAANYPTGCKAVICHYGVNDHRTWGRPLGVIADTAKEVSQYGGLREGLANVRANIGASAVVFLMGPQYYGGPAGSSTAAEEDYSGALSLENIRQAMRDVAALDPNVYYIDANAGSLNGGPINKANFATYSDDRLHPNDVGHAAAWAVAKPHYDAVLVT